MYRKLLVLTCLSLCCFWGSVYAQQVEQMLHAKPVALSGNISLTSIFYKADGIPDRYLPFNYVITGSPVLSLYGMQIPVTFVIGRQQSSFTQPFNQFGLSPSYKWVTVHAGYRNLTFSPYTLAGHTFLGGGVELNPGKFRFAAMYGQLNKATALDTTQSLYFSNFTYKRTGMAVRIGFGTESSFFDLIALKAKDDPNSLRQYKGLADSSGITPAENTVTGYNFRMSFWHQHLIFESNGALSLYTNNINSPLIQDSSYEKDVKKLADVLHVRTSSELFSAVDAAIRYKSKLFSVKLQYRRVDPGFQSMGAYFLNNDLENYTIAPAFTAWKRRIRFSGSLGLQRDDLTNSKRAKANKVIGSANLSADLSQRFGIDGSYSNYSVNQTVKTIRFADSLKVVQSSTQISVTPRYMIPGAILSHSFLFSANLSQAKELNPGRADSLNGDINTGNYIFTYQVNLVPSQASLFLSLNHTKMKSPVLSDGNDGVTLGGSKSWWKNKLVFSLSGGYLLGKRNGEKGTILTGSLQGRYNFYGRHQLRITGFYTGNTPDHPTTVYPKYSESRGEISYGLSF